MNRGLGTYGNPQVYGHGKLVTIGNFCSLAPNITILSHCDHKMDRISTFPFYEKSGLGNPETADGKGPINIGHDVWIGFGVTILSGVTIGHGSVIGAGTVVSKNVPPYMVVAGNPMQFLRLRFDQSVVVLLLQLAWWDWPIDKIKEHADKLSAPVDIDWLKQKVKEK